MVVSAHPLATQVGLDILDSGGNAIDAAIGVQFALAVVFPVAGNIGGGGFMITRLSSGEISALDFREKAPGLAHRDMYLDEDGEVIKGLSLSGHQAAGVPGSVAGMITAFEKYSKLRDLRKLIQPAIDLADKGFQLTDRQAKRLNGTKAAFLEFNTVAPVFVNDKPWQKGDLLIQKDLANTLKAIRDYGRKGFYQGEVADMIVAEMQAGGGIISHDDLKNYEAIWRTPIEFDYKGYGIISMPPPSSGGIALQQLLEMTESFPIRDWGFHDPRTIHIMTEIERRVYADRASHLGDIDFYPVPVKAITEPEYLNQRASDINLDRATDSDVVSAGNPHYPESEETTHFSIVDKEGNAVAITTTINGGFGCKTVVNGAGFLLNNEMDDFSIKVGVPNMFGLIGGKANSIQPNKRMLSSMTPTIMTKEDRLVMVVGTPGGSTIITSVYQVILNVVEFEMSMSEAVSAKRFHHQWRPDVIFYEENAFNQATLLDLEEKGHEFRKRGNIGSVDAILQSPEGRLEGAADPRGDDHAAGK